MLQPRQRQEWPSIRGTRGRCDSSGVPLQPRYLLRLRRLGNALGPHRAAAAQHPPGAIHAV
eukprot:713749-Alexandrium_andersonii.AAC.1